jgi:Carboxypeptidase regulatory-like domain
MRQFLLLTIALAWFATLSVGNVNACSCAGAGSPCESYGGATAVFVGTVIGYRENRPPKDVTRREVDWSPRIFKFSVEQTYLGVDGPEIEVSTGTGGGDCGYEFKNGQRYLVYAYRYTDRLTTSICSRTQPFAEANEDLAFLGNLSSAAPGATIYGQVSRGSLGKGDPRPVDPDISITIEGENERKEIQPDTQGRFRLTGLRPGKFQVTLNLPERLTVYQPQREVSVANRGCAAVVYYLSENGRVSGRVFDINGQPVPRILVSLVDSETQDPTNYVNLERTNEEGRYSFSAVPRGRYIIAINYNRYPDPNDSTSAYPRAFYPGVTDRPHAEIITVEPGAKVTERDVRLPPRRPASIVEGQVVWADGTPVINASITSRDVTYNDSALRYGLQADGQGRFKINGYAGQKLILEARSNRPSLPGGQMERSEGVQITLDQPVHTVKIVITKLR